MGIKGITGLALKYYTDVLGCKCKFLKSDTYYMDYTSKIFLTVRWFTKQLLKEPVDYNNYEDTIEKLLELISDEIIEHINNHRFYKKYIVAFDYASKDNPTYKLNDESYEEIVSNFTIKDVKNSKIMVNKELVQALTEFNDMVTTTDTNELVELIIQGSKTVVNCVWHYWSPDNDITKYVSLDYLLQQGIINKDIYDKVARHHINCYILKRCLKKKSLKSTYEEGIKKLAFTCTEDNIREELVKYIYDIGPSMIVGLLPNIIHRIKTKIKANNELSKLHIEFLGCVTEADYVIKKHILTYSPTYKQSNKPQHKSIYKPTVFTIDTDMLVLLSDIDCVVNLKLRAPGYTNKTVPIQVKEFWKWVLNKEHYTYEDVMNVINEKNSTYNYSNSTTHIYQHFDELEPNFCFIEESDVVNYKYIHDTNSNVLTQLYL